jgi:diaminohydroxyphosphoribosylaminopyrimidine deaminase/5-amino-6-(5-phosphoribosylamino)uracil reductase
MTADARERDLQWMEHALALARRGEALASPNPQVGCAIVRDGRLVGEGFHEYERRDHAEVAALNMAGEAARGATLYVNLEPCSHSGRTAPCADAIVKAGVARVVAAMQDPNPQVAGRGFARLREAGIQVTAGVCEEAAWRLNEAFAKWIRTKRPFVTLKSAMTLDGQLALPGRESKKHSARRQWITGEESRAEVQRMRHASDALLTGIRTVLADDPLLSDRTGLKRRRKLLRVVLDSRLRLPAASRLVQSAHKDVLVFTAAPLTSARAKALQKAGIEVRRLAGHSGHVDLRGVMEELGRREILSVLLEAGGMLNSAALAGGFVDRVVLFYAPKFAGRPTVPFFTAPGGVEGVRLAIEDYELRRYGRDFAFDARLHTPGAARKQS